MAEDIAFRIQLGIILPKLKATLAGELSTIVGELVDIVQAGTLQEDEVSLDDIKSLIMKDLEIFLDDAVFPDIEKKLHPAPETAENTSAEADADAEEATSEEGA